MRVTVLGCGTSSGVPRIDGEWGACDPSEPKNRRRRVSVWVKIGETSLVIDTAPDFREQALDAGIKRVDGVLFTHDHADHTHGIDDLRMLSYVQRARIPVFSNQSTLDTLKRRFEYIFKGKGGYPAICEQHAIVTGETFSLGDAEVTVFEQQHGAATTLGFRIGHFAYSTDLNALDERAFRSLEGVKVWIVDALRYEPHPTHTHLDQTLEWIARLAPDRAILTHMSWDMDYATLEAELPDGGEAGYDVMIIDV